MPLYEYFCEPCGHAFEALIRSAADLARCPHCGSIEVAKQLSVPAAHIGRGQSSELPVCSETGSSPYGCGRPQCGSGMCAGLD
ncbi:MAG: FmdB family zinc ribbon protein [Isosphaeraceae bacterium]